MADGTTITIDAQDTTFTRNGTTTQQVSYSAGGQPGLISIPGTNIVVTKPPFANSPAVGLDALLNIYGLHPFDTSFESQTEAAYDRAYFIARSTVQSGPASIRGGTARAAFELAELGTQQAIQRFEQIWRNQVEWAKVVIEAVTEANKELNVDDSTTLQDNEQNIMAQHANAQSLLGLYSELNSFNNNLIQQFTASRHYGTVQMATTENLVGQGIQNGTVNGFGMSSWR